MGQVPNDILAVLRRGGLLDFGEEPEGEPLTGGVSSDIWLVRLAGGPVCVKRALARLRVEADWRYRFVGELPGVAVPSYGTSDIRLAWNTTRALSVFVVGRNLHESRHLEFIGASPAGNTAIRRSVFGGATWRW